MAFFTYLRRADSLVAQATLVPSSEDAVYLSANVKTEPISNTWRTVEGLTADQGLQINFVAPKTADIFALVNHNLSPDAVVALHGGSSPDPDGGEFQTVISPRSRTAWRIFEAESWPYWKVLIDDPSNGEGYIEVGWIALGQRSMLSSGFLFGFQRQRETINQVFETEYGVIDVGANITQRTRFVASWDSLHHDERDELDGFLTSLEKERTGMLFIPDPDKDEAYYGRFFVDYSVTQVSRNGAEIPDVQFLEDSPGKSLRTPLFVSGQVNAWNAGDELSFFSRASAAYFKNNAQQLFAVLSHVPRIYFHEAGILGLLLEPASQNELTHSESLDNAVWNKVQATITADTETAPNGTMTMDKLVEDTNAGVHSLNRAFSGTTDNTWQAFSFFVKAGERTSADVMIASKAGTFTYATVDFSDGSFAIIAGTIKIKPEPYDDGVWRVLVAFDSESGGSVPQFEIRMRDGSGQTYTGDGASGLYLWGFQFEADRPWPTSYIATGESIGIRAAETAWLNAPIKSQALSMYVRCLELGQMQNPEPVALALIGDDDDGFGIRQAEDDTVAHHNGATEISETLSVSREIGDLVEYIGQVFGDGSVKLLRRSNGSVESTERSSANELPVNWGAPGPLRLGTPNGTVAAPVLLQRVKISRGIVDDFDSFL